MNAPAMNMHSVNGRKLPAGMAKAAMMNESASSSCDVTVHLRRVPIISTNGLHSGLMVHGISRKLVYKAIWVLLTPISLYMISDIDVIAW